jgi:hypothetical protein
MVVRGWVLPMSVESLMPSMPNETSMIQIQLGCIAIFLALTKIIVEPAWVNYRRHQWHACIDVLRKAQVRRTK